LRYHERFSTVSFAKGTMLKAIMSEVDRVHGCDSYVLTRVSAHSGFLIVREALAKQTNINAIPGATQYAQTVAVPSTIKFQEVVHGPSTGYELIDGWRLGTSHHFPVDKGDVFWLYQNRPDFAISVGQLAN
jgi:hypothetical protein